MSDIRDKAREILKAVPEPPAQINSNGPTAATFTRLTGTPHETMWKNWQGGGIMTACNGFVGWYGAQLGSKKYLGVFDMENYLKKIGKGYSWVKSTEDTEPKYGDIYRHGVYFHVGVSLGVEDGKWRHADAGQGGPIRDKAKNLIGGCDVLKRTYSTDAYDYKRILGWIDIDLYFGAGDQSGPVPDWLLGWWKVTWRGRDYNYYFLNSRQAKYTTNPVDTSQPIVSADDTGTFGVDDQAVIIRWSLTGTIEKFTSGLGSKSMQGTWNGSEALVATKL